MSVSAPPALTDVLSAFTQPAALVDRSGRILWGNPAFRSLFGDQPAPQSMEEWEARSPRDGDPLWEALRRSRSLVRRLHTARGIQPLRLRLAARPDGDAVVVLATAASAEGIEALQERTAILEAVFDSLNEGVLAIDSQERIIALSRSAERLTGFAEAEVLGQVCRDVFQTPPGSECPFQAMIRSGQGFHHREMVLRGKGGRPLHVSVNATPLRAPDGKLEGAVVVLRDLSEIDRLRSELAGEGGRIGIVGSHPSILRVIEKIEAVAPSEVSVLVSGESGTGKELVARAIHDLSLRSGKPFVKVNCAALAEGLLESELFGHVRGAFTGAVKDRPGRFEAAHGGTLFLDEIGETSPSLQVKLLRVLQEGEYERVGESVPRRSDVRIVAATNKDLRREVAEGRFREDLFFRLCVVPIELPPLRDRREDIPLLVDHFLKRLALREGRRKVLAAAAYPILQRYSWPGNVRELENALAHAYVCSAGDVIQPQALPDHILRGEDPFGEPDPYAEERDQIYAALEATGWNKGEAAKRLGWSRTTLWRRMRDLGIRDSRRKPPAH
ncbi:sigma-54 interaction domain-containing protein [Deferrisoma camini]|uniref:sigma-54 interaction domain-containing protein n=1 Tax=Deferrisoma camini TaxID=1035120 RepID=UPI00046D76C5|nr:sigma-54-dependent Fis family transcriptional regulator [Deferrisoma camini]